MMMLATGGDPPAVPTVGVILAAIVLVFALTFMIALRNRIVEES